MPTIAWLLPYEGWHNHLKRVQQVRWQLNSWLERGGLDLSEEELYNMMIPLRDLNNGIRSLDAFVNGLSHCVVSFDY